jgi:hypothetical protein
MRLFLRSSSLYTVYCGVLLAVMCVFFLFLLVPYVVVDSVCEPTYKLPFQISCQNCNQQKLIKFCDVT